MYPDISPTLKLEETVSNPVDPIETIGFTGRNKMLGRAALVMKDTAITEKDRELVVRIPEGRLDTLTEMEGEVVVLFRDRVLTMEVEDYTTEGHSSMVKGGGRTAEMVELDVTDKKWKQWSKGQVEVGN